MIRDQLCFWQVWLTCFIRSWLWLSLLFFAIFGLFACGGDEDTISDRLSGPARENSALPIRIDATVTPTPTPKLEDEDDFLTEESFQNETSISEDIQGTMTPTPLTDQEITQEQEDDQFPEALPTPTPTPTPTSTASPQPTPTASKKASSQQKKSVSVAKTSPAQSQNSGKTSKNPQKKENLDNSEKSEAADSKAEQPVSSPQKTIKDSPIVTPYGITLNKLMVCSKISNRNPSGIANTFSFSNTKKVFIWMKVSGAIPPRIIKHIYYWEGKYVTTVKLAIKYRAMRTWSQKTLKPRKSLGKWKVLITTENEDEILAVKEFTITR